MALNVLTAAFGDGSTRTTATPDAVQWDQGQILQITGLELPFAYNVEFCCQGDKTTAPMIGDADGVQIPDKLLETGRPIIAYIVLHEGSDDRETEYWIDISVKTRQKPENIPLDPGQVSAAEQLLTEMDEAVDAAEAAATKAENAVLHYPIIVSGYWYVWDAENEDWTNTGVKAEGEDGFSPVVTISSISGGHRISIQDKTETHVFDVMDGTPGTPGTDGRGIASITKLSTVGLVDTYQITYSDGSTPTTYTVTNGKDGIDGTNGTDGYSPTVSTQAVTGGTEVTITDKAGDHTFTVLNGQDAVIDETLTHQGEAADAKATGDAISVLNSAINTKADVIVDSVSSAPIASFPDGANNMAIREIQVGIEPVQDLHGYDSPWPAGGGDNKLPPMPDGTDTIGGLTVVASNGILTVSGSTSEGRFLKDYTLNATHVIQSGEYLHCGNSAASSVAVVGLNFSDSTRTEATISGINRVFDLADFVGKTITQVRFYCAANATFNGTVAPMIVSSSSATPWKPYANLCPITGHTGVTVYDSNENLADLSDLEFNDSTYSHSNIVAENQKLQHLLEVLKTLVGQTLVYSATTTGTASGVTIGQIRFNSGSTNLFRIDIGTPFTVPDINYDSVNVIVIYGSTSGASVSNLQLELGSTASPYKPHAGNTYPISWQTEAGTVYGGTLQVNEDGSGVLTADRKKQIGFTRGNLDTSGKLWNIGKIEDAEFITSGVTKSISNMFKPDSLGNLRNDPTKIGFTQYNNVYYVGGYMDTPTTLDTLLPTLEICYPLATPLVYNLTAEQMGAVITTLYGQNNVWADTGDVSLDYRADTKLYIERLTAPTEDDLIANAPIASGKFFMIGNTLYLSTASIASGAQITVGTNAVKLSLADALNQINS